jgi:tRNA modification GTPase
VAEADLFLVVVDAASPAPLLDAVLVEGLTKSNALVLVNKADLAGAARQAEFLPELRHVDVSAKSGAGLATVREAIVELADGLAPQVGEDVVAVNARHAHALSAAREDLAAAAKKLASGEAAELLASDMRGALASLGEISGKVDNERMLDALFANFCIGK